jgi:hypothetical protein
MRKLLDTSAFSLPAVKPAAPVVELLPPAAAGRSSSAYSDEVDALPDMSTYACQRRTPLHHFNEVNLIPTLNLDTSCVVVTL